MTHCRPTDSTIKRQTIHTQHNTEKYSRSSLSDRVEYKQQVTTRTANLIDVVYSSTSHIHVKLSYTSQWVELQKLSTSTSDTSQTDAPGKIQLLASSRVLTSETRGSSANPIRCTTQVKPNPFISIEIGQCARNGVKQIVLEMRKYASFTKRKRIHEI